VLQEKLMPGFGIRVEEYADFCNALGMESDK
jgi:hypothetical protein